MIQLKEFVSESLVQIINGVLDAQTSFGTEIIAPSFQSRTGHLEASSCGIVGQTEDGKVIQMVMFDVAVSATEGKESKAGVGVMSGIVGLGAQGKSQVETGSVSRIRFNVPIALPSPYR